MCIRDRCKVIDKMETETHTVFLGKVIDTGVFAQSAPAMTYEYYHKVIKGSSPKTAPTYVAPEACLLYTSRCV